MLIPHSSASLYWLCSLSIKCLSKHDQEREIRHQKFTFFFSRKTASLQWSLIFDYLNVLSKELREVCLSTFWLLDTWLSCGLSPGGIAELWSMFSLQAWNWQCRNIARYIYVIHLETEPLRRNWFRNHSTDTKSEVDGCQYKLSKLIQVWNREFSWKSWMFISVPQNLTCFLSEIAVKYFHWI